MTNLWLFDIDGTLVNINNLHLASYKKSYQDVIGVDVPDKLIEWTFGKPEQETHKIIFKAIRVQYDTGLVSRITSGFSSNLVRILRNADDIEPLEGVVEFLTHLQKNKEYIGAVTGNLEDPAKLELEKSNLIYFFKILSFDDGTRTRAQILQRAIDEARRLNYNFRRVIVVGDTTNDIEAAKQVNAYVVAVATGSDSLKKLKRANPDVVIPTLRYYQDILEKLYQIQ